MVTTTRMNTPPKPQILLQQEVGHIARLVDITLLTFHSMLHEWGSRMFWGLDPTKSQHIPHEHEIQE